MSYFLTTECIEKAYRELTSVEYSNQSILHIFLILKGIGVSELSYTNLNVIKECGIIYAQDLSSLFSPYEEAPSKCDFINPFQMSEWSNNPTELLKKWVGGRIKNNIVGGATTWRKIIAQDSEGDFKFNFDYLERIKKLTLKNLNKISLPAIAIWANRFTSFDRILTLRELCNYFIKTFKLNSKELESLFTTNSSILKLELDGNLHDAQMIRNLIGNPNGNSTWEISKPISITQIDLYNTNIRRYSMSLGNDISEELLERILNDYYQIILSGPPGTSKSYLCSKLMNNYDEGMHIQFHPQYSYQQFIGGYVVEKDVVNYQSGVMLNMIDEAKQHDKKRYLVIIDEINRANTSQVFGDLIQCLDRNSSVSLLVEGKLKKYDIPKNLHIIATMNTTDRTIGALDYALKRRFLDVYCGSNPQLLIDLCPSNNFISLCDFLSIVNNRLFENLKNREFCIGHAIFFNENYKEDFKYIWNFERFEIIFNYKILPLIEEYCYGNNELVYEIVGEDLAKRLTGVDFENKVKEFMD